MDRNGKKAKAKRGADDSNAERSDTKRSKEAWGSPNAAPHAQAAQGRGQTPGAPASPGRKGHRG